MHYHLSMYCLCYSHSKVINVNCNDFSCENCAFNALYVFAKCLQRYFFQSGNPALYIKCFSE